MNIQPDNSLPEPLFIPPGMTIVGTCSLCGGPVMTYQVWHGIIPPPVTCMRCGAVKAEDNYGPKIPMRPVTKTVTMTVT